MYICIRFMDTEGIALSPTVATVVGTGDAVGVPKEQESTVESVPRYWLIARVAPNTERSTAAKLDSLGYETFVAVQKELRYWKNGERRKKKWVERVVITQYVFLHITLKQREEVVRYTFVKSFLKDSAAQSKASFAVIPDASMESLKAMFGQSDRPVAFASADFQIGDEVTLHLGSFDYRARVVRKRGDKTAYYGIRISELGCAYMEVSPSNEILHHV